MPRIVNHPDRMAAFREVAATLVVEEGVQALTLEKVGARVLVSADTVRRTIRSARFLPQLALEHLEYVSRMRTFRRHWKRPRDGAETSWRHAVATLRDESPVDEELAAEAHAWHALTGAAVSQRSAELVAGRHLGLTARVRHLVELSTVPTADAADIELDLLSVIRGLGVGVAEGWATHEDADRLLTRRLEAIAPDVAAQPGDPRAPVAPHVNDR